jgi:hypothetical protein
MKNRSHNDIVFNVSSSCDSARKPSVEAQTRVMGFVTGRSSNREQDSDNQHASFNRPALSRFLSNFFVSGRCSSAGFQEGSAEDALKASRSKRQALQEEEVLDDDGGSGKFMMANPMVLSHRSLSFQ